VAADAALWVYASEHPVVDEHSMTAEGKPWR
jgi:hypothetical protein